MTELDLTGAGAQQINVKLPVEAISRWSPQLQALLLTGLGGVYGWSPLPMKLSGPQLAQAIGFSQLRHWDVAAVDVASNESITHALSMLDDSVLQRFALKSSQLTSLDVSGTKVTVNCIDTIASSGAALTSLSAGRTDLASDKGIMRVYELWSNSLTELNASGGKTKLTDISCQLLSIIPQLEILNLSDTSVTDEGLRCLLRNCGNLKVIELNGCRGLSRSVRVASASGMYALKAALGEPRGTSKRSMKQTRLSRN